MADALSCIIIEDEIMARRSLSALCEKTEKLDLVDSFENANDALEFLKTKAVELIFLDIEMPELSGIEFLDKLAVPPQIIFTTGNKEYAFEAFEYDVTDFLIKPITQTRFFVGVDKAIQRQQQLNAISTASAQHEIYIKSDGKLIRLPYQSILFFENMGDYIKVITEGGSHIIYGSMKALDAKLTNPRFLKVHRSYIVNLDKIKDIEDHSIVIEKHVIPISRAFRSLVMNSINVI